MQSKRENIRVVVRVRPLNKKELGLQSTAVGQLRCYGVAMVASLATDGRRTDGQRDRQTKRQPNRLTDRQTERQTNRQIDRPIDRQTDGLSQIRMTD